MSKISKIKSVVPNEVEKLGKAMGQSNINSYKDERKYKRIPIDINEEFKKLESTYVQSSSQDKFVEEWFKKTIYAMSMSNNVNVQFDVKSGTGTGKTLMYLRRTDMLLRYMMENGEDGVHILLTNNDRLSGAIGSELDEFRYQLDISDELFIRTEQDLISDGEIKNNGFYVISINKIKTSDEYNRLLRRGGYLDKLIKEYKNKYPNHIFDITQDESHLNTSDLSVDVVSLFGGSVILSCLTATPLEFNFFAKSGVDRLTSNRIEFLNSDSVKDGFNKKFLCSDLPNGLDFEGKYSNHLRFRHFIKGILASRMQEKDLMDNGITGINLPHLARCPYAELEDYYNFAINVMGYDEDEIAYVYSKKDGVYNFDDSIKKFDSKIKIIFFDRMLSTGYNLPQASVLSVNGYDTFSSEADKIQCGGRIIRTFSPALMKKFPFLSEIDALNTGYIFAENGFLDFLSKEDSDFYCTNSKIGKNSKLDSEMSCDLVNDDKDALILGEYTTYNKPRIYGDISSAKNFRIFSIDFLNGVIKNLNELRDDNTNILSLNKSLFSKELGFNSNSKLCTRNIRVGDKYDVSEEKIIKGEVSKSIMSDKELIDASLIIMKDILNSVGHYTGHDRVNTKVMSFFNNIISEYLGIKELHKQYSLFVYNLQNSKELVDFLTELLSNYIPINIRDLKNDMDIKGIIYDDIEEARSKNEKTFKMSSKVEYSSEKLIDMMNDSYYKLITNKLLYPSGKNGIIKKGSGYDEEKRFLDDMHTDTFSDVLHILKNGWDGKEFIKILFDLKRKLSTYSVDFLMSDKKDRLFLLDVKGDENRVTSKPSLDKLNVLLEYSESESKKRGVEIIAGYLYYEGGVLMIRYGLSNDDFMEFHKLF